MEQGEAIGCKSTVDSNPRIGTRPYLRFIPMVMNRPAVILASASPIRRQMLAQAGIAFTSQPSHLDENAIKSQFAAAKQAATALACAKAERVSSDHPGDWVIGSDSIVTIDDQNLDKPRDRDDAANHLRRFSGKWLVLTSAVALARGGTAEWHHCGRAELRVRDLSDDVIEAYLDAEWPEVGYCVGVFRLEGRGVTLFERIDGDYFTILGMPLLPLLGALRDRGVGQ